MERMVIGTQVRAYREKRGLTQEQLADRSHLSRNYVSSIENGHRSRISIGSLDRIATTLGVTVDHLLDENMMNAGGAASYPDQEEETQIERLLRIFRQLNPRDRKRVLDLAYRLSVKVEPRIIGEEGNEENR
jgi:transcriptional regulator with XRE-family HTH domain